jgi:hypothetical protein
MTPKELARVLGWSRVAFGAVAFLAPRLSARLSAGPSRDLAGLAFGVRGMGARDVAVGLGAARARTDAETAAWMGAAALIDLADTASVALSLRRLGAVRGLLLGGLALGGAVAELYAASGLRDG